MALIIKLMLMSVVSAYFSGSLDQTLPTLTSLYAAIHAQQLPMACQ